MAKAKKTSDTSSASKKKAPAKKAAPAAPAGMPMVDTSLAAQLAARALANRAKLAQKPQAAEPAETQGDSATFKQLKESIAKPHNQLLGDALHKITPAAQRPGNLPTGQDRQSGHAQTHSLNRVGVPRRTPG